MEEEGLADGVAVSAAVEVRNGGERRRLGYRGGWGDGGDVRRSGWRRWARQLLLLGGRGFGEGNGGNRGEGWGLRVVAVAARLGRLVAGLRVAKPGRRKKEVGVQSGWGDGGDVRRSGCGVGTAVAAVRGRGLGRVMGEIGERLGVTGGGGGCAVGTVGGGEW
nr:ctenidin-3-like [Arachis hypogaea]